MSFGESIAPLLGRFVLGWFFLTQAYRYAVDWRETALLLSMKHLPAPGVFLAIGLLGAVLGAVSLILGFRTRAGALTLFTITVAATVTMHDYWHIGAAAARELDYDIFARNIGITGGLLAIVGMGGGRFGFDSKKEHAHAGGGGHGQGHGGRGDGHGH